MLNEFHLCRITNHIYTLPASKYAAKNTNLEKSVLDSQWCHLSGSPLWIYFSCLFFFFKSNCICLYVLFLIWHFCVFSLLSPEGHYHYNHCFGKRSNFMFCFFSLPTAIFRFKWGTDSNNEFQLPWTVKRPRQSFCSCIKQEFLKNNNISSVLRLLPHKGADGCI